MTTEGKRVEAMLSNYPVHVTAARLWMLLNLKGYSWAAARDGGRYCDTRLRFVLLNVNRMLGWGAGSVGFNGLPTHVGSPPVYRGVLSPFVGANRETG